MKIMNESRCPAMGGPNHSAAIAVLAIAATVLGSSTLSRGAPSAGDENYRQFLVEGLIHSEEVVRDVLVEYTIVTSTPHGEKVQNATNLADGSVLAPLADRMKCTWAKKGDMELLNTENSIPAYLDPDKTPVDRTTYTTRAAYDGTKTRSVSKSPPGPEGGKIESGYPGFLGWVVHKPARFADTHARGQSYASLLVGPAAVYEGQEEVDGHMTEVLHLRPGSSSSIELKVWLDPNRGFRPLRISLYEGSTLVRQYEDIVLKEYGEGVWYPVSGTLHTYSGGELIATYGYEASHVAINTGLADSMFQDVFKPGTQILDADVGVAYSIDLESTD